VLKQAGCGKIFTDKMTGSRMDRQGWDSLIAYVWPGDTLVVTELSRMTRSLLNLLETARLLEERKVDLVSLRENIDTSTATGRCFLSMMGPSIKWNGNYVWSVQPLAGLPPRHAGNRVDDLEPMLQSWRTHGSCMRKPKKPLPKCAISSALAAGHFSRI
jgi:hypothetical protein